jgi:hypothetical protein
MDPLFCFKAHNPTGYEGQPQFLAAFGLHPLMMADSASGGATNSQHLIGFGRDLGFLVTPSFESGLPCTLWHMLDGSTEGHFPLVPKSSLLVLVNPAWAVLLHDGIAQPEGLPPSWSLDIFIYAPLYKLKDHWLIWGLTLPERLWLHQVPLHMDPLLVGLSPCGHLPFKDLPSPEVYTSIFCQLWGASLGGSEKNIHQEVVVLDKIKEDLFEGVEDGEDAVDGLEGGEGLFDDARDVNAAKDRVHNGVDTRGFNGSMMASITALPGPDMPSSSVLHKTTPWNLQAGKGGLEGHELGPPPRSNMGPPFPVGHVIKCDVPGCLYGLDPGWSLLQRGFILEAEDPRYKI